MSIVRALLWVQILLILPVSSGAAQTRRDPAAVTADPQQVRWRREYNEVAAAIDTLVRLYGRDSLERLTKTRARSQQETVVSDPLVLLFWADDEAEVFLNGYPVSRTRLTPTRVEIPRFYLRDQNELRVHCWDTDSVESGFMAGLYVQDPGGGLRSVIVTGESFEWHTDSEPAQEIFYSHSVPDIPDARVIWGDQLFGELWLQAAFTREAVVAAAHKPESGVLPIGSESRPMDFHQVVTRLVSLEGRRDDIAAKLGGGRRAGFPRYGGDPPPSTAVAFSLGRAAPLAEGADRAVSQSLRQWAQRLPATERALVLRPQRHLKGWQAATPAVAMQDDRGGGGGREEDRRADYRPPPERGTGPNPAYVRPVAGTASVPARSGAVWIWVSTLVLTAYLVPAGRQWWRLFTSVEWTSCTGSPL